MRTVASVLEKKSINAGIKFTQSVQRADALDSMCEIGFCILDFVAFIKNTVRPTACLEPTIFSNIRCR